MNNNLQSQIKIRTKFKEKIKKKASQKLNKITNQHHKNIINLNFIPKDAKNKNFNILIMKKILH